MMEGDGSGGLYWGCGGRVRAGWGVLRGWGCRKREGKCSGEYCEGVLGVRG